MLRHLSLGAWNGFTYTETEYPAEVMMSFHLHASQQEGIDFTASGICLTTTFTITGNCEQDCDGNISVRFQMVFADSSWWSIFCAGHLLPDGTLVGTRGWDENYSDHAYSFILKRTPSNIMCHRPSPNEFLQHKSRALWKFAISAIRAQRQKERWSWAYFAERRRIRTQYMKYHVRVFHYGPPLDEQEAVERVEVRQRLTLQDATFCRSILDSQLKITPLH